MAYNTHVGGQLIGEGADLLLRVLQVLAQPAYLVGRAGVAPLAPAPVGVQRGRGRDQGQGRAVAWGEGGRGRG